MLGVSLFGGLRLRHNGKNIRLASRPKVVPLLAYLLLNCRQPVARDSVAFALWPDETEAAARSNAAPPSSVSARCVAGRDRTMDPRR